MSYGEEDYIYALTQQFKKRLAEAREIISRALEKIKKPAVACSTGKDSTALLALVLEQTQNVVPVFYDSGAEYPETYEMIEKLEEALGVEFLILEPELPMKEIIELENEGKMTPSLSKRLLIIEPSKFAVKEFGIDGFFIGLRAEESKFREIAMTKLRDSNYMLYNKEVGAYQVYPLANWTAQDVFAYLAQKNLPLHPIYTNEKILLPREKRRVGSFAGASAIQFGRWYWLKQSHPELYNKLFNMDPAAGWYV